MGKAKKRSFQLGIYNQFSSLSREDAVKEVVKLLEENSREADNLITLFGMSAEEILEAGASYEAVKSKEGLLRR